MRRREVDEVLGCLIGLVLVAAFLASFLENRRHVVFAFWVTGLGVGSIYLILGAEWVAVIQWIVSTLATMNFIFFSVVSGEFYADKKFRLPYHKKIHTFKFQKFREHCLLTVLAWFLGAAFVGTVVFCVKKIVFLPQELPYSGENDLNLIGRVLTQEYLLSLQLLGVLMLITLVGSSVIACSDKEDAS